MSVSMATFFEQSYRARLMSFGILSLNVSLLLANAGVAQTPHQDNSILQKHYDQAQKLQASGDLPEAASQYRIFIADGLAELAIQAADLPDYGRAAPLFDEALRLAPRSPGLMVRYAQAALSANNFPRTVTLTEGILHDYPQNVKASAKAHLMLGRVLLEENKEAAARTHFEAAVRLDPNFENGYALAIACLDLDDKAGASQVFEEMIAGLGDSAVLHMEIGRAYLNSDFQQEAIPEFTKAVAMDGKLAGAHYSLALAYLTAGGEDRTEWANAELNAELALSPNDGPTHAQLGNIALQQHRYDAAERELKQSIVLSPQDPLTFFYLGRMYSETSRNKEAMTALRQSIALTRDPAMNRYQVQKAHYLLGRLLLKSGQNEEGKQEMQISSSLLKRSLSKDRDRLSGDFEEAETTDKEAKAGVATPQTKAVLALDEFEKRLAPAIADSYNNLGVIAANGQAMEDALNYFRRASEWSPGLPGLDANWGLAAFRAGHYAEAIGPLTRSLRTRPADSETRAQLAISLSKTGHPLDAPR
jgi:tetratricopeptide (TPR) repeat protein